MHHIKVNVSDSEASQDEAVELSLGCGGDIFNHLFFVKQCFLFDPQSLYPAVIISHKKKE